MTKENPRLTHVAPDGTARMVDIGAKPESARTARATGHIVMTDRTLEAIVGNTIAKGDVLGVARVAGIMAAKRTADLIPLCHPLTLTSIAVRFVPDSTLPGVRAEAVVHTVGRTGVEMEALTAVTVALLTIYDMAKGMDKSMVVNDIALADKTGGVGGPYTRA